MKANDGTLEHVDGRFVLRFERRLRHPPEKVWRALIEPAQLAAWMPAAIEGERAPGARLRFVFPDDNGPALEGVMRVFEPPRLLEYTWGDEILRWELSPDGSGSRLVFTTTFDDRANAPRDATGWHVCLDALAAVVAGEPVPGPDKRRFPKLYGEYVARLGLGDFPAFMKAGAPAAAEAWHTPGLEGHMYEGAGGTRIAIVRASQDAESEVHPIEQNAYLLVVEGTYLLRLGDEEMTLGPGTELQVPGGMRVSGRVSAGTRLFHAFGGPPATHAVL